MRVCLTAVVVLLSLAMLPCQADQDDLSKGVFITHYVPDLTFSSDPPPEGWCKAYLEHAIQSYEDQNVTMLGPQDNAMWVILCAWDENKRWAGTEFGFMDYNADLFAIYDYGPCYPPTGGYEISSMDWPAPNSGTAVVVASTPWTGNYVPVYWFAGYVYALSYGQTVIPLGPDPVTSFSGWVGVPQPPQPYEPVCLGGMGINVGGEACQPAVVQPDRCACCLQSGACVILTEARCLTAGGQWLAGTPFCNPDPCSVTPPERACCLEDLSCLLLEYEDCQNLDGRWLSGTLSCDPNPCSDTYVVRPDGSGDFPTIQAAIDAAPDGTTILLTNGTFTGLGNRNVDFRGKTITVGAQSQDPELCVIDCQHMGRAFIFDSGEGPETKLHGVTIIHGYVNYGGAILVEGASPTIVGCVMRDNEVSIEGGALTCTVVATTIRIKDCLFESNHAGMAGGAVYCQESNVRFEGCIFLDNTAGAGGAMTTAACPYPAILDCTFSGNSVTDQGGAILFSMAASPMLLNCTFVENSALVAGSGIRCDYADPNLYNTIIAFSAIGDAISCNWDSWPTLHCCDIYGNPGGDWTGHIAQYYGINGNISLDPLFYDRPNGDLRLWPESPCAPFSPPNTECDLIGAWPVVDPQAVPADPHSAHSMRILACTPNPFTRTAQITYELPGSATGLHVCVAVHDPEGRVVRTIVDRIEPAGVHRAVWDGCDQDGRQVAGGIYYVRLQAGEEDRTQRLVLLR